MTLPRHNRRTVVVDGTAYFWTSGRSPENMWVTVQSEAGGSLLRIDAYGLLLPADVAEAIRFARSNGWSACKSGCHFFLGFNAFAEQKRFVTRAANSPPFWRECVAITGSIGSADSSLQSNLAAIKTEP